MIRKKYGKNRKLEARLKLFFGHYVSEVQKWAIFSLTTPQYSIENKCILVVSRDHVESGAKKLGMWCLYFCTSLFQQ